MVKVAWLHEARNAGLCPVNAYTINTQRRQQARPARHEAGTLELNERKR